ncbi:zinc ribbon domain-containing protein [Clostridium sp.]|uniref:zinc ribbon domain-containing protein n=1 Tax=Clostridium sp. TaxID=1506 RepID=UPI003D6D0D8F
MNSKDTNCQSCGMPIYKDEKGAGTETDGSLSEIYCSHCYKNGEFTLPDITVNEMRALVTEKIVAMKIPKIMAYFLTKNTRKLKRWKK